MKGPASDGRRSDDPAQRVAKVFGIGFHKTGTTSLADALRLLGYRVTGANKIYRPGMQHEVAWQLACELLPTFDAFQDNPWPLLYRELDRHVPGSKFVLTVRPDDEWLDSVVKHFGRESTPMREWIYGVGSPVGHEGTYLERYRRHNREVAEYFKGRQEDLLIMRITEGDGWDVLSPFLGVPIPEEPFPRSNLAQRRSRATSFLGRIRDRTSPLNAGQA